MKHGWEIKKLGEVVDIINGRNQSAVVSKSGQYPIYGSAGNLMGFATDYLCKEGTTIIGRKGNISNPIYIEEKFWNVDTAFGLYPKNGYKTKFINYLCQTIDFKSRNRGTTIPSLVKSDLLNIDVPFISSLSEQQRIVSILDEAFAAIAKAKANAEQNLKNAKELFESYLQGVFEKKGDGWEEKIIKEVCELKSGTTISSNLERVEGDVLYVKVGDMTLPENEVEINTSSRFVNSNEIKSNQIIPNGAIIFPKRGGAIATNKKRKIIKPTIVDLNTMSIIPGNQIDADYFFYWFQLIDLNNLSNGTSIPQINNYSFDDVKIPFPISLKDQQTIVRQLDALRAETQKFESVYQKKIADLEELKKSILQKAFAGELKTIKLIEAE